MGAGTPMRRRKLAFYAASTIAMTFLAIVSQSTPAPEVAANAGADDTALTNATIILDCSDSTGATTYAWTLTDQLAGSACDIADPAAAVTTALCSLPYAYVFTCTIDAGEATEDTDTMTATVSADPHPLWASFDVGEFKYTLNHIGYDLAAAGDTYYTGRDLGEESYPIPPTRPTCSGASITVSDGSATTLRNALKNNTYDGGTVTVSVSVTGTVSCDEQCDNKCLRINPGVVVDGLALSDLSGAAQGLEITGGGHLGQILSGGAVGCLSDLYVHGVTLGTNRQSTPSDVYAIELATCFQRVAFAHTIVRGYEGSGTKGACAYISGSASTDFSWLNSRCKSSETWSGVEDAWGIRVGNIDRRALLSGWQCESWVKPCFRVAESELVGVWTPYALRGTAQQSVLYGPWNANAMASVSSGGLTDNFDIYMVGGVQVYGRQNPSFAGAFWGPSALEALIDVGWWWGDVDFYSENTSDMSASLLAAREAAINVGTDDAWYLDVLSGTHATSNAVAANTHTNSLPAMTFGTVTDPEEGVIGDHPDDLLVP